MPKLIISSQVPVPTGYPSYQLSPIQIQDPFPSDGRLVIEVAPGATVSTDLSMDQLQRIRSQLVDLEQRKEIFYAVTMTTEDRRSEEADQMADSAIEYLDTSVTPLTHGVAVTGAQIIGTKLLMGFEQAAVTFKDTADPTDWLVIQAIDTGAESNMIGIEIINDAGVVHMSNVEYAEPTVLPDGYQRVLEIHILPATFHWDTLATILNDPGDGIYARTLAELASPYRLFVSTAGAGSGADVIDCGLTALSDGTGAAPLLTVGDTAAVIMSLTNTLITYDVDLTGSAMDTDDTAVVRLRSTGGGPSVSASVVIA